MLTILKLKEEPEKKLIARLLSQFTHPQTKSAFKTAENVHYLEIEAMMRKGVPDWRMICASTLDPGGRILVQKGMQIPQQTGLVRFAPSAFERKMLENLTLDILVQMETPPAQRRLVIYGRENEVCRFLPSAYLLAGEIRVLTRRPHALADIARQLQEETGTSVTVTDNMTVGRCDILLATSGGTAMLERDDAGLVISPDAAVGARRAVIQLPSVLEEIYDVRFDAQEFTAAFYEIAGLRSLGSLHPQYAVTDRGDLSSAELAEYLDHRRRDSENEADC